MRDEHRDMTRCRALALTREYPPLNDADVTGPGLAVQGACNTILRMVLFASSLAVLALGTFLYLQYLRRFMR